MIRFATVCILFFAVFLYAETRESDILHSDETVVADECKNDTNSNKLQKRDRCKGDTDSKKQKHLSEIQEKLDAISEAAGTYDSGELTERLKVLREELETDFPEHNKEQKSAAAEKSSLSKNRISGRSKRFLHYPGAGTKEIKMMIDRHGMYVACDVLERSGSGITAARKEAEKIIYLTFDDGPLLGTSNVLEVLEEENVDATMFFVGKHIQRRKQLFKEARAHPNILIANHTYSHANGHYTRFYNNKNRLVKDIEKTQNLIGGAKYQRLAGRNVWRIPGIFRNDYGLSKKRRKREAYSYNAVANKGYFIYGWDMEWRFSHKTGKPLWSASKMARKIDRCYRKGRLAQKGKLVLLAHDFMFRSKFEGKSELRKLIRLLKKSGWKFETIKNYSVYMPHHYARKGSYAGDELALNTVSDYTPETKHYRSTRKKRKKRHSRASSHKRPNLDLF